MENPPQDPTLQPHEQMEILARLRLKQNLLIAILAGVGAALISAIIWAAITVATEYQIGWMAVGVGFAVGFAVRLGKGIDTIYGIVGAVLSLMGCLLGNFFSLLGFVSKEEGISVFELIPDIDYSLVPGAMADTFSPIDLLFYGIAIYEGYKLSFRRISEQDILSLQ